MITNFIIFLLLALNTVAILHLFNIKKKTKKSLLLQKLEWHNRISALHQEKETSTLELKNQISALHQEKRTLNFFLKKSLGYKTVIISNLSVKSDAIIPFEGYLNFISGINKAYEEKVQFIVIARNQDREAMQKLSLPFNTTFIFEENKFKTFEECIKYYEFFTPDLVVNLVCEIIPRNFKFANILNDGSPFQEILPITSSHVFLISALSYNYKKIIAMKITDGENDYVEKIKENLRLKLIEPMKEYSDVLNLSKKQLEYFRSGFSSILLFSYSPFTYDVANGKEEIKRILKSVPQDMLVIMTIHPALKDKHWFSLFKTAAKNTLVDSEISAELTGEVLENPPLAELKKQFPNLILENELELFKISGKPNLRPFTELLLPFVDGIIVHSSKVCFNAMYFEKPIFSYKAEEDIKVDNFSFALSGLSVLDIATFDFNDEKYMSNKVIEWNKVLMFMFTRIYQRPEFYSGSNTGLIFDFIEYQKQKRQMGFNENDFEFYEKEWQTIEEVYNAFKNV